ncbi:MAG: hypothetical protein Wins2KO_09580 [Winogradskyella sp.]
MHSFKTYKLLILLVSFLFSYGLDAQDEPTILDIPCSDLLSDKDYFRGFGTGESQRLNIAQSKAIISARTALASSIKSDITSETTITESDYKETMVSKVNEELRGCYVVCQKFEKTKKGTFIAYVAVELKKENIYNNLEKFLNNTDKSVKNSLAEEYSRGSIPKSSEDKIQPEEIGTYHALLIGVEKYADSAISNLDQPLNDVNRIHKVLTESYNFDSTNVVLLKNPSKIEITNELDRLANSLKQNDNLLIFYAGHGFWDEGFKQGYWLPSDAKKMMRGSYISNSTIRDYMKGIPSQHILLITDACFSGGIFKSRAAFSKEYAAMGQLYNTKSRVAITSGTLTEVPDNSVFLEYLVKELNKNKAKYLSAEQLFSKFKIAVMNNSVTQQIPQYGKVHNAGDEGGDFIFIRN